MNDFQPTKPWTIFTTIRAFATKPRQNFASVVQSTTFAPPLAFVVCLLLACTALRAILCVLFGPPVSTFGWLYSLFQEALWISIATVGLHLALRAVKREPVPLALCLRLVSYSLGPWFFSPLWVVLPGAVGEIFLLLTLVYILGLLFAGLRSASNLTPPLAAAVIIIDMVFILIAAAILHQSQIGG